MLSEIVQIRLVDIEYEQLTEETVRKIIVEETGKEPSFDIRIYCSDDYIDEEEGNGFNGTIIHIYNDELEINQSYTIFRGTEKTEDKNDWRPIDWTYNIMGIFIGKDISQLDAARKFEEKVTNEVVEQTIDSVELKRFGLGHSLGGNLITILQLMDGNYKKVLTLNAAPPSLYQIITVDRSFQRTINNSFDLTGKDILFYQDAEALQETAEEYYKDRGKNIYHITTKQDILQSLFSIRGFFRVGNYEEPLDAFPGAETESLAELFELIPDEFIRDLQIYLAENLSSVYSEDGFDGLLTELTGIDPKLIDIFHGLDTLDFKTVMKFNQITTEMGEKIPELLAFLDEFMTELPSVLDKLVELEYITAEQKENILSEFGSLRFSVRRLDLMISSYENDLISPFMLIDMYEIYRIYKSMSKSVSVINNNLGHLGDQISSGVAAHSIYPVLNALSKDLNRSYIKSGDDIDLMIHQNVNGKDIQINISSASRIYVDGLAIFEQKQEVLERMKSAYTYEYILGYQMKKGSIMKQITDMEQSPHSYQHLLGQFTDDTHYYYRLTRIDVHEDIPEGLPEEFDNVFEGMFGYIESTITKEKELLHQIQTAIEDLFTEEERIAGALFGIERLG